MDGRSPEGASESALNVKTPWGIVSFIDMKTLSGGWCPTGHFGSRMVRILRTRVKRCRRHRACDVTASRGGSLVPFRRFSNCGWSGNSAGRCRCVLMVWGTLGRGGLPPLEQRFPSRFRRVGILDGVDKRSRVITKSGPHTWERGSDDACTTDRQGSNGFVDWHGGCRLRRVGVGLRHHSCVLIEEIHRRYCDDGDIGSGPYGLRHHCRQARDGADHRIGPDAVLVHRRHAHPESLHGGLHASVAASGDFSYPSNGAERGFGVVDDCEGCPRSPSGVQRTFAIHVCGGHGSGAGEGPRPGVKRRQMVGGDTQIEGRGDDGGD